MAADRIESFAIEDHYRIKDYDATMWEETRRNIAYDHHLTEEKSWASHNIRYFTEKELAEKIENFGEHGVEAKQRTSDFIYTRWGEPVVRLSYEQATKFNTAYQLLVDNAQLGKRSLCILNRLRNYQSFSVKKLVTLGLNPNWNDGNDSWEMKHVIVSWLVTNLFPQPTNPDDGFTVRYHCTEFEGHLHSFHSKWLEAMSSKLEDLPKK